MKIWKAEDGIVSHESEVVLSDTGNPSLAAGAYCKPFMLDEPTVVYFPGKGTVLPGDDEERKPTDQEEINQNLQGSIANAKALYDVHLSAREHPPTFYVAAYTDNRSNPPSKKEKSVTAFMKKYGGAIDAALKWNYGYSDYSGSRLKQVIAHANKPDSFFSHDAKMFVDDMIMPALTDAEGELHSKGDIEQKLDNLTLIGFSYGSIFCREVENRLARQLDKKGMPEQDKADVMKHLVTVSSSSVARTRSTQNLVSAVQFEGRLDVLRRHVQSGNSELNRGIITSKKTMPRLRHPDGRPNFMYPIEPFIPEAVVGMPTEKREKHSWKGLEVRETVYQKRGLIYKIDPRKKDESDSAYNTLPLRNTVLVLLDAPDRYTAYNSLDDIYQEHPDALEINNLHHEFGAALLSDPNKQGHVLLFNRVLNNAIERGRTRGGVDMEAKSGVHDLLTQVPWDNMMPPTMTADFQSKLQHAFYLGGMEPITSQTCDVPAKDSRVSGMASALRDKIRGG